MAKQMYNAREPATSVKIAQLQKLYRDVYPRICGYELKVANEEKKHEKPKTLKDKIIGGMVFWGLAAFSAGLVYLFIWAIQNITETFTLSMSLLGILIGGPLFIITIILIYASSLPSKKEVYVKFPLKKEEATFRKLIIEIGEELGTGSELNIFIKNQPMFMNQISFKQTLPHHILFRGDNDDKSKRSFLFEIVDDEITVLLPDENGVYKYDKKPKYDGIGLPDANSPRYIAETSAIIGDNFL